MPTSATDGLGLAVNERGFSLIEVTIAVAIIAGLSALAVMSFRPLNATMLLARDARTIEAALIAARARAIRSGETAAVDFDFRAATFSTGRPPVVRALSNGATIAPLSGERRDAGSVRFFPDGSTLSDGIAVSAGHKSIRIEIEWLSGRVRVAEASSR